MSVRYPDSLEKIKSYLDLLVTNEITISPFFYRDYTCPSHCGGCCPKFSLVYFEGERWESFKTLYPNEAKQFKQRTINDGQLVYEDVQEGNENHHCKNLNMEDGRCKIHKSNPFSCEFELMKIRSIKGQISVINKLFGRGWQLKKINGERGALCEMKSFNYEKFLRDVNLLKELQEIPFKLGYNNTILPELLEYFNEQDLMLKNGFPPILKTIIKK